MALSGRVALLSLALASIAVLLVAELLTGAGHRESQSEPGRSTAATPTPTPQATEPSEPAGPPLLLPDLRSLRAEDISVQETAAGRQLRFAAWLANLGPGPLLLRPIPPGRNCAAGRHAAVQVVHRDVDADGRYRTGTDQPLRRRFAGCMARHEGHDHWHFDAMASYVLRNPATGEVLAARRKVSFCLRDNRRVRGVETLVRREYFGECSRTTRQGISPGWVDIYSADLSGQALSLPRGRLPRLLCLDLAADPRGLVAETDEGDNGTSIGLRISGSAVRRAPGAAC